MILILEQGDPPAAFPFEVEYHKPATKTRNKLAEKEKVTIKKKEKVAQPSNSETGRPRIIM